MANFLNKLGDMARNAADKTGEKIEIGKLRGKISSEQKNVAKIKEEIGDYYYLHAADFKDPPQEVAELCRRIDECQKNIAALEEEIQGYKGEDSQKETLVCPSCGAANTPETKFCGECGVQLL